MIHFDTGLILPVGVAFLAGVASVFSPCILPMVPVYLAMAGDAAGEGRKNLLSFAAGFMLLFTAIAAVVSVAEVLLGVYQEVLRVAGAVVLASMGLYLLAGGLGLTVHWQRWQMPLPRFAWRQGGYFLTGVVMGLQWIPCVGPLMTAVLSYAAASEGMLPKITLWAAYCCGFLTTPALLFAVGLPRLQERWHELHRISRWLHSAAGIMLLLLAYALLEGEWLRWIGWITTLL